MGALQDPAANRRKLLAWCEIYLMAYHAKDTQETLGKMEQEIQDAFEVFRQLSSSVVCLLDPRPGHTHSKVADFEAILNYKGDELVLQAMKSMFQSEGEQDKNPWFPFIDDLLTRGPETIVLMPSMVTMMEALQAVTDETALSSLTAQILKNCHSYRPKFVKGLRSGLLKPFDTELRKCLVKVTEKLVSASGDEASNFGPAEVQLLHELLGPHNQDKDVAKTTGALSRRRKLNTEALTRTASQQILDNYPNEGLGNEGDPVPDTNAFLDAIKDMDLKQLDEKIKHGVWRAIAYHVTKYAKEFVDPWAELAT